jgi:WD40 repeat protein
VTGHAGPKTLNGHVGACFVSVSADNRWLGTGAFHGSGVRVWDAVTAKCVQTLPVAQSANLAFSPYGQILVTSTPRDFSLWDVGTWRVRQQIPRPADQRIPGFMAFSPDGQLLAATLTRAMVQLIDPVSGRALANLISPGNHDVGWICFHPDGTKLAVACGSDQVEIWDLRLIREHLALRGLDWDLPAYVHTAASETANLKIQVSIAD